jgi:hypothetical protein
MRCAWLIAHAARVHLSELLEGLKVFESLLNGLLNGLLNSLLKAFFFLAEKKHAAKRSLAFGGFNLELLIRCPSGTLMALTTPPSSRAAESTLRLQPCTALDTS